MEELVVWCGLRLFLNEIIRMREKTGEGEKKGCRTPALTCTFGFFFFFCKTVGRLSSCRGEHSWTRTNLGIFFTFPSPSAITILISVFMREYTVVVELYLWKRVKRCVRHFFECRCLITFSRSTCPGDNECGLSNVVIVCLEKRVFVYFGCKV